MTDQQRRACDAYRRAMRCAQNVRAALAAYDKEMAS